MEEDAIMPTNTEMPKATNRYDPYRNFRFRVLWDGKYVAGVSKVSALTRTTQVVKHRPAGDPSTPLRMPGQSEYEAITLERGITNDAAFLQWANKVWDYRNATGNDAQDGTSNQTVSLQDYRKDIILELYNEAGQKVLAYKIYRCWPSEFTALPELDANGDAVAIQRLKLENEGWERDTSGEDVTDPSDTLPAI